MSRRVHPTIVGACLSAVVLSLVGLIATAQASVILYEFNGTQTGSSATVHVSMGVDSSVTTPGHSFTQANLSLFSVQYTGAFTGSGTALPASLSGVFNTNPTPVFSSLFAGDVLTTPSGGTTNFQFFGSNGQSWQFVGSGTSQGTFNFTGSGTWQVAPVPVPAALWLFGSGLVGVVALARRKSTGTGA